MGNLCLSKQTREIMRKFDEGEILRPCQKHSNLTEKNKGYRTDLIDAMLEGHLTCVKALIDAGADVNERCLWDDHCTPLHCHPVMLGPAASDDPNHGIGHVQCVKYLIEAGADLNATDPRIDKGMTPLLHAAEHGHHKCVELILKAGADVNFTDKRGHTAVMKATFNARLNSLEVLVQEGADVNKCDKDGYTPLHSLAKLGHHKCLHFLVESGADVSLKTGNGATALEIAALNKESKCLELLIKSGADVNTDGTPLIMASWYEMFKSSVYCIKPLLKAGAYINKRDKYEQNAIKYYITTHRVHKENVDEGLMLLYAAGETIEGTVVDRYHHSWQPIYSTEVPTYILQLKEFQTLKEIARNAVRKHLIEVNDPKNLFFVVPHLQFPSILKSYLMFDMSVD